MPSEPTSYAGSPFPAEVIPPCRPALRVLPGVRSRIARRLQSAVGDFAPRRHPVRRGRRGCSVSHAGLRRLRQTVRFDRFETDLRFFADFTPGGGGGRRRLLPDPACSRLPPADRAHHVAWGFREAPPSLPALRCQPTPGLLASQKWPLRGSGQARPVRRCCHIVHWLGAASAVVLSTARGRGGAITAVPGCCGVTSAETPS